MIGNYNDASWRNENIDSRLHDVTIPLGGGIPRCMYGLLRVESRYAPCTHIHVLIIHIRTQNAMYWK